MWEIGPLPQGDLYSGPDAGQDNLCQCNTVVYSLVSACGACQGSQWTQYVFRSKLRKVLTNDVLSDGLSGSTIVLLWLQLPRRCSSAPNASISQHHRISETTLIDIRNRSQPGRGCLTGRILTSRWVSLFASFLALYWCCEFFFPNILLKWRRRPTLGTPPRQRSRAVSRPKWSGSVENFLTIPLFGISSVHSTATKIRLRVQRPLSQRQHRHRADQAQIVTNRESPALLWVVL